MTKIKDWIAIFIVFTLVVASVVFAFIGPAKGAECTTGNEIHDGYNELVGKLNLQEGQNNPYKYYRFTGETAKSALTFIRNNYNAQSMGFESIIMVYSDLTGSGYVGYFDDDTMNSCATTTFQVPAGDIKALINFIEGV